MKGVLDTAGERLSIDSELSWVGDLLAEGTGGELRGSDASGASIQVRVEARRNAFNTQGWELLTRGAWQRNGELVVENACTVGFDLHLSCSSRHAEFTYRWRPPTRDRVASRLFRSRFHLLARAILMQYPALWWAGTRGAAPLHASACAAGDATPMLTAASGIGRSTVVLAELASGSRVTGDNIAVGDGATLWGLVEPLRVEGGSGRRMPHGRNEVAMPDRARSLVPDSLVVLARGESDRASLTPCGSEAAARSLITGTYMAGELRRYWAFAAVLSAGTGFGAAHPPVTEVSRAFANKLPCFSLVLGRTAATNLSDLFKTVEVAA